MKVAIICPGQFGDIAESTPLCKYREELWGPDPEIHWFIAKRFAAVLDHNPHVVVREYDIEHGPGNLETFQAKVQQEEFDATYITAAYGHLRYVLKMPLPMIPPMVLGLNLRGRAWRPQIFLTEEEIAEAKVFTDRLPKRPRVMIETVGFSFQSAWDDEFTGRIVERLAALKPLYLAASFGAAEKMRALGIDNVVGLDNIGFRQLTEVYNACDLFISCGSGVASVTAAERCRILPRIEYLVEPKCPGWGTSSMVPGFAHWEPEKVLDRTATIGYAFLGTGRRKRREEARRWRRRGLQRGQPNRAFSAGAGG